MSSTTGKDKRDQVSQNENKLAGLYEEYYDKIAHYVFVRIGDKNEADDIASEVFLKALKSISSYEEQGIPMQAWLFKIAHNMVVDHLRKVSKYQTVPIDAVEIQDKTDPAEIAEINITMESVRKAMDKLTIDQREVLRLRFFGGLSSREVAGLMKKTDGSVREMQRSALEKLRQLLSPHVGSGY